MKNAFTIRPAKNHDAKKIFNFLCELEGHLFDQQEFEINYRICLAGTNNIYLVAADEKNDVIGFISCHGQILLHHGGMVYEIHEFFVMKEQREKGAGKLLLKALEEHLAKRDYRSLEVAANRQRTDAIGFYRKYGLEDTHLKFALEKKK